MNKCNRCKGSGVIEVNLTPPYFDEDWIGENGKMIRSDKCFDCSGTGSISDFRSMLNDLQKCPMPINTKEIDYE